MREKRDIKVHRAETIQRFAARLTRRITVVVLLTMGAITTVVYAMVRLGMAEEAEERYMGIMLQTQEQIRRVLSDIHVAAVNSAHDVERDLSEPDSMLVQALRIVSRNNRLAACGLLFTSDYYPQRGHWYGAYARRDTTGSVHVRVIGSKTFDYLTADWFTEAMAKDDGDWMKPYFDNTVAHELLTTYAIPLRDAKGRKVGLLTADVSLEWIRKKLEESDRQINRQYETGMRHHSYSFVVDGNGLFILHPNEHRMLNENIRQHTGKKTDVVGRMLSGKKGSGKLVIDGVSSRVFWQPVESVGWTVAVAVPETAIYYDGLVLNLLIIVLTLSGLAIIYLVCRRTISHTSRPLTDYAAQAAGVERELHIAHGIQMGMVPKNFALAATKNTSCDGGDVSPYNVHASLTPAREVGGDFYDFMERDGNLYFCIGDVSGKGIPAALVMAVAISAFRMLAEHESDPAQIVSRMNTRLASDNEYCLFITLFVGILDQETGILRYCNAGHKVPLVGCRPLATLPNLPVGVMGDWNYVAQQTRMKPDETLFLYTDGLTEAENALHEQFGTERMTALLEAMQAPVEPRRLVDRMAQAVHEFVGDTEQSDDLTLLAIQYVGKSRNIVLSCDTRETARLTEFVTTACTVAGLSDTDTMHMNLAVEEAVVNVMTHAYPSTDEGSVAIAVSTDDKWLTFTISDSGKPFDPTTYPEPDITLPTEERPVGGLGIHLMRCHTDALHYERRDGRNILSLRKKINIQ